MTWGTLKGIQYVCLYMSGRISLINHSTKGGGMRRGGVEMGEGRSECSSHSYYLVYKLQVLCVET